MRAVDSAYTRLIAAKRIPVKWMFRLIDESGKVFNMAPTAVAGKTLESTLDGGTWSLTLDIYPGRLPAGVNPLQYWKIEVDRVVAGTVYPYFRGIIDKTPKETRKEQGATVVTMTLDCFGVLQRTKGHRVNSINIDPLTYLESTLGAALTPAATTISLGDPAGLKANDRLIVSDVHNGYAGAVTVQSISGSTVNLTAGIGGSYTYPAGSRVQCITQLLGIASLQRKTVTRGGFAPQTSPAGLTAGATSWTNAVVSKLVKGDMLLLSNYTTSVQLVTVTDITGTTATFTPAATANYTGGAVYYTEPVPGGQQTLDITAAGGLVLSQNADLSSPYVKDTDFTVYVTNPGDSKPVYPARIIWYKNLAATRYIQYAKAEKFVAPTVPRTDSQLWFKLPYGRSYTDYFHTKIAGISGSVLTLADGLAYKSTGGMLDVTQGEWVTIIKADGLEVQAKIASTDSTGKVTLVSVPAGIAVGDPIRLSTTEFEPAWDDDRMHVFYSDNMGATKYNYNVWSVHPNSGLVVMTMPNHWVSSSGVWAHIAPIRDALSAFNDYPNRIENTMRQVLYSTGLFALSDVVLPTVPTGTVMKNYARAGVTMGEILIDWKENAVAPNCYIHDTQDGKVTIKNYSQLPAAQWTLSGVSAITEEPLPEPIGATTVILEDKPINLAAEWFFGSSNLKDAQVVVDGSTSLYATPVATGMNNPAFVSFRVPPVSPLQAYPHIESIKITGVGTFSVMLAKGLAGITVGAGGSGYTSAPDVLISGGGGTGATAYAVISGGAVVAINISSAGSGYSHPPTITLSGGGGTGAAAYVTEGQLTRYFLDGHSFKSVGSWNGTTPSFGSIEVSADDLLKVLNRAGLSSNFGDLVIRVDDMLVLPAALAEVEIQVKNTVAWRAELTDDTTKAPADGPLGTAGFGKTWQMAQPTTGTSDSLIQKVSYRYAPTSYIKRISTRYTAVGNFAPRHMVIKMDNISQVDCRDYAERRQDEELRVGKRYKVTALYDDRAELGDTVKLPFPAEIGGGSVDLFLWGVTHSGALHSQNANYTLVDFGL